MKRFFMGLLAAGIVAVPGAVIAHHSFAVFDTTQTVTLNGTVKEFQFTNPHTWLELVVKDADNKEVVWPLEGSSLMALYRSGWKKSMIKPGDKVKVTIHPLKSGVPGGNMLTVTLPNGEEMKTCCS